MGDQKKDPTVKLWLEAPVSSPGCVELWASDGQKTYRIALLVGGKMLIKRAVRLDWLRTDEEGHIDVKFEA